MTRELRYRTKALRETPISNPSQVQTWLSVVVNSRSVSHALQSEDPCTSTSRIRADLNSPSAFFSYFAFLIAKLGI